MIPEVPDPPIDYVPWVEHVYASLRWAEGSIRSLHELLESETVDDELRKKGAAVIALIGSARLEAFHAFEKMGGHNLTSRSLLDLSAIGNETKVKILELNAAYLELMLTTPEANSSHASLIRVLRAVIHTMKQQATEIAARLKKTLDGPCDP